MSEHDGEHCSCSADVLITVHKTEIRVQSPSEASSDNRWSGDQQIRLYGYSPGLTALQIRGVVSTRSGRPAYAHALLDDDALLALYEAVKVRLEERAVQKKDR